MSGGGKTVPGRTSSDNYSPPSSWSWSKQARRGKVREPRRAVRREHGQVVLGRNDGRCPRRGPTRRDRAAHLHVDPATGRNGAGGRGQLSGRHPPDHLQLERRLRVQGEPATYGAVELYTPAEDGKGVRRLRLDMLVSGAALVAAAAVVGLIRRRRHRRSGQTTIVTDEQARRRLPPRATGHRPGRGRVGVGGRAGSGAVAGRASAAMEGDITTVAGNGTFRPFSGDGGPATAATLNFPWAWLGYSQDEVERCSSR